MADMQIPDERPIVTRAQAREHGLRHYFTGKPCKHGHIERRYTSDGGCFVCELHKHRRWREENREKSYAATKRWQAANTERVARVQKARYDANPEKYRQITREWAARNPLRKREWWLANKESYRRYAHQRRAAKHQSGGDYQVSDIEALLIRQGCRCVNCKASLKKKYEIDHVTPLALGGSNGIENIQLLCRPCNRSKGAKEPIKWAQENGRLL